jgi:basic membrane protein A
MAQRSDSHQDSRGRTTGTVDRRAFLAASAAIGGVGLAGCLGDDSGGDEIAIISSDAGFDDNAFNDMALSGLENAQDEYDFEINRIEETDTTAFGDVQVEAAETEPELIVLVGFQHTSPLEENAPEYPDQNWMLINDPLDEPNVASYTWANHEMSYLAGVLAGTMTTRELENEGNTNDPENAHVGFVGGEDGSLINAFEESYIAGAEWVEEDIEISTGYIGNFSDTSVANDIATSQFQDGADIVYHAAAAAGAGAIEAAQQESRFAIGVDADQSQTLPEFQDVIIGSAVKYIDEGTNEAARAAFEDDFDSIASEHNLLGLEEEAVDAVIGQAFEGSLPDAVGQNIDEAKQGIVDGDIDVPCEADGC